METALWGMTRHLVTVGGPTNSERSQDESDTRSVGNLLVVASTIVDGRHSHG